MLVETKYEIGYTFWSPRVRKRYVKAELEHNGQIWYREVEHYESYVKQKKIVEVNITIRSAIPEIKYYVEDATDGNSTLPSVYSEDQITEYSEEQAFSIAFEYSKQKKEYFG